MITYFFNASVDVANAYYRDVWVYSNHYLFLSRSRGSRSTSQRPVQYLFEVGGNIGIYDYITVLLKLFSNKVLLSFLSSLIELKQDFSL